MLYLISGIAFLATSVSVFWMVRPSQGQPHPLAVTPYLESTIPVVITSCLAFGIALLVAAVTGLF